MKIQIKSKILAIFYVVCIACIFVSIIDFYKFNTQKYNNTPIINESINIESVGESINLDIKKNENIKYEIDDENIINIDKDGNIVGTNEGTTTITIIDKDKTETITVTVGKKDENKTDKPITNSPNNNENSNNNNENNTENNSNKNEYQNNNTNENNNSNNESKEENKGDNDSNINNNQNENNNSSNESKEENKENNKIIKVNGIYINKTSDEIYINSYNKTINLSAEVRPSNAANKNIKWSSSNINVATVNNGVVTAINPGTTTITATSEDGNYTATTSIAVKKKVIIIIGASQVTRMDWYKKSYASAKNKYNVNDGTLVYVQKGGTGIDYQTNDGLVGAKKTIDSYGNIKNQIEFYIYFPLSGNTIRKYTCGQISTTNSSMIQYAKNYNDAITSIRNNGYNVNGYVVSMHPVKITQTDNEKVVSNQNANSCKADYRSNWKYYKFNLAFESLMRNYYPNIYYQELFTKIMNVNNEGKNFSFKITYNTSDGVHWDSNTTNTYVNMMLNENSNL